MHVFVANKKFLLNFVRLTMLARRPFSMQCPLYLRRLPLIKRKASPGFEKCLGCFTRMVFTRGCGGEFDQLNKTAQVCVLCQWVGNFNFQDWI